MYMCTRGLWKSHLSEKSKIIANRACVTRLKIGEYPDATWCRNLILSDVQKGILVAENVLPTISSPGDDLKTPASR